MLSFLNIIIVLSVVVGVMVINYLIFNCSKISPCYIEFDDRKKSEMRLMRRYNEGFDKIFKMYMFTSIVIAMMVLASFSFFAAIVLLGVQIMYTIGASVVMIWMYIRSVLYWNMEFRRTEEIRRDCYI